VLPSAINASTTCTLVGLRQIISSAAVVELSIWVHDHGWSSRNSVAFDDEMPKDVLVGIGRAVHDQ